jgi:hypothetical protein
LWPGAFHSDTAGDTSDPRSFEIESGDGVMRYLLGGYLRTGQPDFVHLQRVIDMRHLVARKLHVHHGTDTLYDSSFLAHRRFLVVQFKLLRVRSARNFNFYTAAAPATISDALALPWLIKMRSPPIIGPSS